MYLKFFLNFLFIDFIVLNNCTIFYRKNDLKILYWKIYISLCSSCFKVIHLLTIATALFIAHYRAKMHFFPHNFVNSFFFFPSLFFRARPFWSNLRDPRNHAWIHSKESRFSAFLIFFNSAWHQSRNSWFLGIKPWNMSHTISAYVIPCQIMESSWHEIIIIDVIMYYNVYSMFKHKIMI